METPSIQVNQQINVGTNEFDRESRKRILDTVQQILQASHDVIDVEEGDIISDRSTE